MQISGSVVSIGIQSIVDDSAPHHYVQHSVPTQEVVCPMCSKAGSKGVKVGVVDGRVACLIQETEVFHVFLLFPSSFPCVLVAYP